jgi:starvation-inducible DNA-binding protein
MKASPTLTTNLQAVLVDLIELHVQGKQAHWNIVGTNFRDLHLQLDEIIEAAREFADDLAERMRALHALPDGRSSTVSKSTSLAEFPNGLINTKDAIERIVAALEAAVGTMRKVHDEVDEEEPTTADLLQAFIA